MTELPPFSQSSKTRFIVLGSALVAVALLATSALYALVDRNDLDGARLGAFAFAILVCWLSATVSLAITAVTTNSTNAVSGLFFAIAVRTGLPLLFGFVASMVGPLSGTDIFGVVLIHYLVALFVETLVAVKLVSGSNAKTTVS